MIVTLDDRVYDTLEVNDTIDLLRYKAEHIKAHIPPQAFADCADMIEMLEPLARKCVLKGLQSNGC